MSSARLLDELVRLAKRATERGSYGLSRGRKNSGHRGETGKGSIGSPRAARQRRARVRDSGTGPTYARRMATHDEDPLQRIEVGQRALGAAFERGVGEQTAALRQLLRALAQRRPLVVILDNASIHTAKSMQPYWELLEEKGMRFYFLPPYSPELNRIEMLWKKMKYEWLPFQSFTPEELEQAIDKIGAGFGSEYQLTFC